MRPLKAPSEPGMFVAFTNGECDLKRNQRYRMAHKPVNTVVFLPEALRFGTRTLFSWKCAKNTLIVPGSAIRPYGYICVDIVPLRGAPYIPGAEAQGLTARFDKKHGRQTWGGGQSDRTRWQTRAASAESAPCTFPFI